jgi:HAD superfamily hydrolase (TIGR01459 family)
MSFTPTEIPILNGIAGFGGSRKAWLCDVWGVLHDGVTVFAPAIEACRKFQRGGGEAVLVSNSPRPSAAVLDYLGALGVPLDCFNALVTSGDVTRAFVEAYSTRPVFHLGPDRDMSLFDGLTVRLGPAAGADAIVCTGFFNEDSEVAEDYDGMLAQFAERGLPMICANPDLTVERGDKLLPCAGLLAERYAALGQKVIHAGKPHRPIYDAAMRKLSRPFAKEEILAIGDGIETDVKGACGQGIDSLYIASRVHMGDTVDGATLGKELARLLSGRPFRPAAAMTQLQW